MKKIKIGLLGASGKMGQAIQKIAGQQRNTFELFLAVSKTIQPDFIFTVENLNNTEEEILNQVDVWIDFTSAEGLAAFLDINLKLKTPLVSGSTGLSEKTKNELKKQSTKYPLFWASNMSVGLWYMRQAIKVFFGVNEFDYAVTETHHSQKKDNPSGTAKTLQSDLEKITGVDVQMPAGLRVGGVFGVHTVVASSQSEVIKIEHEALNRDVFAEGALKAAQWLVTKKPALYSMDDLMLKK